MSTSQTTFADLKKRVKTPMSAVMQQPPKQRIQTLIDDNMDRIRSALPRHLNAERLTSVMLTAVTSTPKLLECYTPTLFGAMIKSTQLGLEPNNALGQSYLVPFHNRKENRLECQLIIGYRGMLDIARRSGNVASIQAKEVREGDIFEYEYGLEEKLKHIPGHSRGRITHFYAYAKLADPKLVVGAYQFEVLTREDVDKVMQSTQSKGEYGPWKEHYAEMGKKTAIRKLFKLLPMSIEMAQASNLDSTGENQTQHLDRVLDDADYEVVPQASDQESPVVDVNGEIFDENLHAQDRNGNVIYNKDGSFRKRPRGRTRAEDEVDQQPPDWGQPEQEAVDYAIE